MTRVALCLCCLLALGCAPAATGASAPTAAGPAAPDFTLDTLDGERFQLSEQRESVVLVDFWATWCAPCLRAMPQIEQLYQRHRDAGLLVVGVAIDGPDSVARVRSEVKNTGVTFPIVLDQESEVMARYNPRASAPYSVLIGRGGRIVRQQEGFTTGDHAELERVVEQALAAEVAP